MVHHQHKAEAGVYYLISSHLVYLNPPNCVF